MDFRILIKKWPSVIELANDLKEKPDTVKKWRTRNSIPSSKWKDLLKAAKKRKIKITCEQLVRMAGK